MTRVRAPGKVVVSGAYAVLRGAPAVVLAVDRHAIADTSRAADFVSEEVRAALGSGERAPHIDATALREGDRKLGLGSSAAILVASLYALDLERDGAAAEDERRRRVFARALVAHRTAQGGGSGIDVASSTFGGTLGFRLEAGEPRWESLVLPPLELEVWACPVSAVTSRLLAAVSELERRDAALHAQCLGAQARASVLADEALRSGNSQALLHALRQQADALRALGIAAGVPIVPDELWAAVPSALETGGALLPAGAGGGDLAIYVGAERSSLALRETLSRAGHWQLAITPSVPGVSALSAHEEGAKKPAGP